ncbi:MAG: N-acetylglucosamine-6-phosphate deacetylase [Candidatus Nanopelagicaceae bacterium]
MKPLYVDLQVNGHGGVDLLSAKSTDEVRKVSRSLYDNGVVGYLPTIITSALSDAVRAIKLIEEVRTNPLPGEAKILGTHLEGPFISIEKRGVHPLEHIAAPDLNHLKALLKAGLIKIVTIAPELPGAIELIQYLVANEIVVSLGHTNANREEAIAGFNAGAKTVTHLFNAMPKPPLDGTAQVAIEREDVVIQIIIDEVHVPNELVKSTLAKVSHRFIVTNDPIAAAGLGSGTYSLGNMQISVDGGQARRVDGTLAGGIGTLGQSLEIMNSIGVNQVDALASITTRPCELIGVDYQSLIS